MSLWCSNARGLLWLILQLPTKVPAGLFGLWMLDAGKEPAGSDAESSPTIHRRRGSSCQRSAMTYYKWGTQTLVSCNPNPLPSSVFQTLPNVLGSLAVQSILLARRCLNIDQDVHIWPDMKLRISVLTFHVGHTTQPLPWLLSVPISCTVDRTDGALNCSTSDTFRPSYTVPTQSQTSLVSIYSLPHHLTSSITLIWGFRRQAPATCNLQPATPGQNLRSSGGMATMEAKKKISRQR